MHSLLSLSDIGYSQGGKSLVEGVSLSVSRGQTLGLLGINGAGKSTTLKIAAGILSPDEGQVWQEKSLRIGYLPQTPPLIPQWTTQQYLQHCCQLHQLPPSTWQAALERVVSACDLAAIFYQRIATLSKGSQQRVGIAQAIIHQPDLLIVDEPTSGLDPRQVIQFRSLIQSIKSQTGILFSSHIMSEVSALCDTAVVLHQGKLMGELDLTPSGTHLMIEFAATVDKAVFGGLSYWQSGAAKQHYFCVNTVAERQDLLRFCLQQQLPVISIADTDKRIENEFLSLITPVAIGT